MGTERLLPSSSVTVPRDVEKMGPLRGDGKNTTPHGATFFDFVEKMGPLRGDGKFEICVKYRAVCVEKMGPLRGDGNIYTVFNH